MELGVRVASAIGARWRSFGQNYLVNIAGDGCFRMNMNEIQTPNSPLASIWSAASREIGLNNHVSRENGKIIGRHCSTTIL